MRTTVHRALVILAIASLLATPLALGAQTRVFITKLGSDTFALERVVRNGDKIDGMIVRHLPATSMTKYSLTLNKNGSVASQSFVAAQDQLGRAVQVKFLQNIAAVCFDRMKT